MHMRAAPGDRLADLDDYLDESHGALTKAQRAILQEARAAFPEARPPTQHM